MTSTVKINQLAKLIGVKAHRKIVDVTRKFGTAQSLTEARINCNKVMRLEAYTRKLKTSTLIGFS